MSEKQTIYLNAVTKVFRFRVMGCERQRQLRNLSKRNGYYQIWALFKQIILTLLQYTASSLGLLK